MPLKIPRRQPCLQANAAKSGAVRLESRTTAQIAAALIDELPLPAGADVAVLGDSAYDAESVQPRSQFSLCQRTTPGS